MSVSIYIKILMQAYREEVYTPQDEQEGGQIAHNEAELHIAMHLAMHLE